MKTIYAVFFGVVGGLFGAGLIWLVASPPRGQPISLSPAPTAQPVTVHVSGAVADPGVYPLPEGSRVRDAIEIAGGLLDDSDLLGINLAARLEDGDQLWVPEQSGDDSPPAHAATGSGPATTTGGTSFSQPPTKVIDLNKAQQAELESLPGIGPATALKIIAYREEKGAFTSIEGIMNVSGIGPATFDEIKDLITVFTGINPR